MNQQEELLRRIEELEAENERLQSELRKAKETIAEAKDIRPVKRPTLNRVRRLAKEAFLDVTRHSVKGFVVAMGRCKQWYEKLRDIWDILKREEWDLAEVIPSSVSPKIAREKSMMNFLIETAGSSPEPKQESIIFPTRARDFNKTILPPVKRQPRDRKLNPQTETFAHPKLPERFPSLVPKKESISAVPFT
ncbi:hypothetical protein ACL6C3_16805 [Capilliphycus salinus ALCB114379]|uniref:hypothetical protein n=1 Tax=Capilliphycus salinus TaxID=2768948 RepID=UPI0039A74C8B